MLIPANRHDIFDDQARKQYLSKAADLNPFGDGEKALKFSEFDIFVKVLPIISWLSSERSELTFDLPQIRVLQQLTQWVMIHPERIRDKMEEQKDMEQTTWVRLSKPEDMTSS